MGNVMIALLALVLAVDAAPTEPPAAVVAVAPVPAALRDAKSILADYAKAIGDERAWRKHKSLRVKREVSVKSMHFTSHEETRLERGGKLFSTSEMPSMGTFRRGSDGHTAWAEDPIGGLRILKDAEAEDVRIAATWNSEWRLGDIYKKAISVPSPVAAPAGQACECVELSKSKGEPTVVCFDSQTHLRVLEKGVQASQGGQVPYVTRFSDWRSLEGVKVWYQEDVTVGPVTMEGRIIEVVFDEHFPAALFGLPKKGR
ncbi:MAG TPA: hypothetical protein VIM14_10195 [Polyangia bacterium]